MIVWRQIPSRQIVDAALSPETEEPQLSLEWAAEQLRQLVLSPAAALPEGSLSVEELRAVLKMHAHQRKLKQVITPTAHPGHAENSTGVSSTVEQKKDGGIKPQTTAIAVESAASSCTSSSDSSDVPPEPVVGADDGAEKMEGGNEERYHLDPSQLSPAAYQFLCDLPDLTFLL